MSVSLPDSGGRFVALPFRPSVGPNYVFSRLVPAGQFALTVHAGSFPLADATGAVVPGSAWQGTVDTSIADPPPARNSSLDRLSATWPTKTVHFSVGN